VLFRTREAGLFSKTHFGGLEYSARAGVLRLRMARASRGPYSAQDDSSMRHPAVRRPQLQPHASLATASHDVRACALVCAYYPALP
jgi:hypothetical protein